MKALTTADYRLKVTCNKNIYGEFGIRTYVNGRYIKDSDVYESDKESALDTQRAQFNYYLKHTAIITENTVIEYSI